MTTPPKIDYKGELVELDTVSTALAELKKKYATVPDASTKEGYSDIKKGIRELTGYRTKTDKLRLAVTEPHREFIAATNEYGNNLINQLKAIEEPLKAAKKDEDERAEREKAQRIAKLRERIQVEIWSFLETSEGLNSSELADLHSAAQEIDIAGYFDVTDEASDAKVQVVQRLSEKHAQVMAEERLAADQAELDAERARLREAEEVHEAERKELEELRKFKAEQEEVKRQAEQRLSDDKLAGDIAAMAPPTPERQTIQMQRYDFPAADALDIGDAIAGHEQNLFDEEKELEEAAIDLMALGLSESQADLVVQAIQDGDVRHVRFNSFDGQGD